MCKYHTIDQLNKINVGQSSKKLSLMHLNISSLPYHLSELSELLNDLTTKLKILGIREGRSEKSPITDINLLNYDIKHMPNKINKRGALPYIPNELSY